MAESSLTQESAIQLPDELEACHSLILELMKVLNLKESDIVLLKQQLRNLQRDKFGRRSEKISPGQLSLFREQVESMFPRPQATEQSEAASSGSVGTSGQPNTNKKKNGGGGRNKLNPALPREIQEHFPEEKDLVCNCGCKKTEVGHETTEQLDHTPASLKVIVHIAHTFACPKCQEGFVSGKKPEQIFSGGKATEGLIAQIATAKYADHLPLYRQEEIYAREGAEVSRSSMGRYLERGAEKLKAVRARMIELAVQGIVVQVDETPIKFISPERTAKKVKTGYCWALYGDTKFPYVIYDVQPDRCAVRAQNLLAGFENYLLTDGYNGYDWYDRSKSANCNVHARRYFEKARNYDKEKSDIILALYGKVYDIEKRIGDLTESEILEVRQRETVPIMNEIKAYLDKWKLSALAKTPLGIAVNYAHLRWDKLCLFTKHGFLRPDTNLVENSIRPIAIGRKNWLHIGDEAALETASLYLTLVNTCKRLNINPYLYLRDLFIRLGRGEDDDIEDLLPDKWINKNPLPPPNVAKIEQPENPQ